MVTILNVNVHRLTVLESRIKNLYLEDKYKEAIELCNQLLKKAEASEDFQAMLKTYIYLAGSYYNLGKIENAFNCLVKYKELCDEYGNTKDRFQLYSLSAIMYEYDSNYEKAKEMIQECINITLELEMYQEASVNYNTYSSYLNAEGNYIEACEVAKVALDLARKYSPSDILLQCHIHINIALAFIGLCQYKQAKNILDSLQHNPYINDHPYEKGYYLFTYALYYVRINQYSKALEFLQPAYSIYSTSHHAVMLKRVLKTKIYIYEKLEDFQACYFQMKEYINIAEQLSKFHLSCKMAELDIKNSIAAIEKRANIDGLTGIYNRYYLETTCNQWIKEMKETGEQIWCIIFDVDNFKKINDTFGHLMGDEVIKTVAQTTKELFKSDRAIVGRYGGDEFIVFLREYEIDDVREKVHNLFHTLTNIYIPYLKNEIRFTVSMGVVNTDSIPYVKKFEQIFKIADQALYLAKKQGKNQIISLLKDNCNSNNPQIN